MANSDGTGLHQITPYGLPNSHDNGLARWSPDGSKILFASEHGKLFVVHTDGTGLRRITLDTGDGWFFALTPSWSPDGRSIVFSLFAFLGTAGRGTSTPRALDGSELVQLTDTPSFEDFAGWGIHPPST